MEENPIKEKEQSPAVTQEMMDDSEEDEISFHPRMRLSMSKKDVEEINAANDTEVTESEPTTPPQAMEEEEKTETAAVVVVDEEEDEEIQVRTTRSKSRRKSMMPTQAEREALEESEDAQVSQDIAPMEPEMEKLADVPMEAASAVEEVAPVEVAAASIEEAVVTAAPVEVIEEETQKEIAPPSVEVTPHTPVLEVPHTALPERVEDVPEVAPVVENVEKVEEKVEEVPTKNPNDPYSVINWIQHCASKLRISGIVQDCTDNDVAEDEVEQRLVKQSREKFAKLMETHTELTARIFFLKQLQVGSFGPRAVTAAHKELLQAKNDLSGMLENDEFSKASIHMIADDCQAELEKVFQLDAEYRELLDQLADKEEERKVRRGLKRDYDDAVMTEGDVKANIGQVEDSIARSRAQARESAESAVAMQGERENLEVEAKTMRDFAKTLDWYEALTGMLGGLGGLTIATGGVDETSISIDVSPPLGESEVSVANSKATVKFTFDEGHVVLQKIEVMNAVEVPFKDLALHAIKMNDWQLFIREYRFRCLNVALTEQEVSASEGVVSWMGMKNVVPKGFGHVFVAKGHDIQVMADLEYPQSHSIMHKLGVSGRATVALECEEEHAQKHGGSKVCALLAAQVEAMEAMEAA